ncbi:hypothetical protein CGMCC3_g5857 [Colletotrichum fructicola]|nr:uncharacterized protein CGMCC3_g5857 [Colletotrichum fructicola]KAE9578075.1 hypothetical protein CGMCC3_g5857 [Colletotrichum fructicola]
MYSKLQFANPGPFGYGAFSTTLMTLSLSMMGIRNVENPTVFIANLCFLAGIGLLISAQWEMVRGNTFAYTTLIAFAFYYGGYGFLLIPSVGIVDGYGGKTAEYLNAFGFYLAASGKSLTKVAGSFGFIAALVGFYAMAHGFCGDVLPFEMPLGDLSRFFARSKLRGTRGKAT